MTARGPEAQGPASGPAGGLAGELAGGLASRTGPRPESRFEVAMRQALAEGRLALGSGDVPVGALVLDASGAVIGRGHNEREALADPTAHAELLALRRAAAALGTWRLTGCSLVVTLEPCTMCAGALVLARIDRAVYGAADPKAGAAGSLWDVLRDRRLNHRPEVVADVLAEECASPLRSFFTGHRARP